MKIRPALPEDAEAVVALRRVVYPYLVRGVAVTRQLIAEPAPEEQWAGFVAEADGRLVGWASANRNVMTSEAGRGELSLLHVHPDCRRRGLGDALFAAVRDHLDRIGVRRVRGWASTDSLGFARRHGFEPGREVRYSALGLTPAPVEQPAPAGVRFTALSELDNHDVYEAYVAACADEPGDVPADAISYPMWRYDVWDNLGLDRTVSTVALSGREILAFSLVQRDGERMWSDMTATVPQHRNRGLARLVKSAALHRAAADGITVAYTANDAANVPMLAVNSRLGYRPVDAQFSCLGDLPR